MKAAAVAGGAAALPLTSAGRQMVADSGFLLSSGPTPTPLQGGPYFLLRSYTDPSTGTAHDLYAVATAICDRILPADTLGPGAAAAGAVNYVDLFLSAFQTPPDPSPVTAGLINTPPIYLQGQYSGRWPFGNDLTGKPGSPSADSFETSGVIQFLDLTAAQSLAWYVRIYGTAPGSTPSWASSVWLSQTGATGASATIPGAQNLRAAYRQGLAAFDDWAKQNFSMPFAATLPAEQDVLLLLASNPVLAAASGNGFPGLPAPLPNPVPPPAAAALFGVMVLHTIQGSYALPEYDGKSDKALGGQVTWASVGWDGDTQPLGNTIYFDGPGSPGPGAGENAGFGGTPGNSADVFVPQGTTVEFRPMSTPDGDADDLAALEEYNELMTALEKAGCVVKVLNQL